MRGRLKQYNLDMAAILNPDTLDEDIDAIVRTGAYSDSRELIRHALEVLLLANPSLRRSLAVRLYREDKVTLSRAAEIAGLDIEGMKELLASEGVERIIDADPETARKNAELIRSWNA